GTVEVEATRSLVREIQFMLERLGMDPGPIDGVVGPQTLGAYRKFQERFGLPVTELVMGGKASTAVLARLRSEASRVIFEGGKTPEAPASSGTARVVGSREAGSFCGMQIQPGGFPDRHDPIHTGQVFGSWFRRLDGARGFDAARTPQ